MGVLIKSRLPAGSFTIPHYSYFKGPWWQGCLGVTNTKHKDQQMEHEQVDPKHFYFYSSLSRFATSLALINSNGTRLNQHKFLTFASSAYDHLQFWERRDWEELIRKYYPDMAVALVTKYARAFEIMFQIHRTSDKILNPDLFKNGFLLNKPISPKSIVTNPKQCLKNDTEPVSVDTHFCDPTLRFLGSVSALH